jgi:hypothetical protein
VTWVRGNLWAILACGGLFLIGLAVGAGSGGSGKPAAETQLLTVTDAVGTETGSTVVSTETVTVTTTETRAATSTGASSGEGGAPAPKTYRGDGGQDIVVYVRRPGYLRWTNTGDIFQIFDDNFEITVNSQARSGKTFVSSAGKYVLSVNAIGSWTITVP